MQILSLLILIGLFNPCFAESYTLNDLRILMKNKEYTEALSHMKDITPSNRNEEWKTMALTAALAQLTSESSKPKGCAYAWQLAKSWSEEYAFFKERPEFKKEKVRVGICWMKTGSFYEYQEKKDLANEVLKLDPDAIYTLVLNAGYDDHERAFMRYLDKNSARFLNDEKVKIWLAKALNENLVNDHDDASALKKSLNQKFNLAGQMKTDLNKDFKTWASEAVRGDFTNDYKGKKALVSMKNLGQAIEGEAVASFILANLVVAINTHEMLLPYAEKMNARDFASAEKALTAAQPADRPFWFGGAGWDEKNEKVITKKYLAGLLSVAKRECSEYRKNNAKEPKHVTPSHCDLIQTL